VSVPPELLCTFRGRVLPEWVDYNGHLRDAFYLLIFSLATDELMNQIGLDEAGRKASGNSLFTLECHLNYLHEVKQDTSVTVLTQILGHDSKRLQVYHSLYREGFDEPVAANEQMLLHVDMAGPRSAPFGPALRERIATLAQSHQPLGTPRFAGRRISLPT
jgi:acyl-CoA thioester hydrolase